MIIIDTKYIGNLTELQCMTRFYELGYAVSIPYGDSEKYDFILDVNGKLYRLQVKHANVHITDNGTHEFITVDTSWQSGFTKKSNYTNHKYSKEEIDYFVTHYNGSNYMIPVEECGVEKRLRILPPKNNQSKGVNYLADYIDVLICKNLQ